MEKNPWEKPGVTVQKARDPIASEKQIVFIRQLQTQWRWDKLAVQVQTPNTVEVQISSAVQVQ